MDEILEQLRELSEQVSLPLDLPTDDDVLAVEEAILIPLPFDLRTFLLEASDVIVGNLEPVTAADERSHTYLPEVAAQAWSVGLPRDYIPVCEYDGGYAAIAQDGKIAFWCNGKFSEEWDDFWYWCRDVWLDRAIG